MSYRKSEIFNVISKCDCDALQIMLMSYLDPNVKFGTKKGLEHFAAITEYNSLSLLGAAALLAIPERSNLDKRIDMLRLIIDSGGSVDDVAERGPEKWNDIEWSAVYDCKKLNLTEFLYSQGERLIENISQFDSHLGVSHLFKSLEAENARNISNIEQMYESLLKSGHIDKTRLTEINAKAVNCLTEFEEDTEKLDLKYDKKIERLRAFTTHVANIINAHDNLNLKPSEEVWFDYEMSL